MVTLEKALELIENCKPHCSWTPSYGLILKLIDEIEAKQIIEIGVAYGYHSEFILQNNKEINYLGIDPYKAHYDDNDCFAEDVKRIFEADNQQDALDLLHEMVRHKMSPYQDRFKLIRNNVENIYDEIENDSVDIIFIDGDHTYDGVIKDLKFSWDKVNKNNGILCGDDIKMEAVKNACNDFFKLKNLNYKLEGSYWVFKFDNKK